MNNTRHSRKRLKQRAGFNKKVQDKVVKKAFAEGIAHKQTKGILKKYITGLYRRHNNNANNIRIYNRKVWVFSNELLITVFHLPKEYHKLEDVIKKKLNEKVD